MNEQPKVSLDVNALKLRFRHVDPLLLVYAESNVYATLTTYSGGKVNGAEKSKGKSKDSKGKRKNAGKPKGKSKDGKGNDCGRKVKNTAARSRNV